MQQKGALVKSAFRSPQKFFCSAFFFFGEHRAEAGLGFLVSLSNLQLAEDRVPADVDFVPGVFQVSQDAFIHFAQVAQGGSIAHEIMDLLPTGGGDFDSGEDQFEFLHQDALGFQELVFVLGAEFLTARQADELIELLPAL